MTAPTKGFGLVDPSPLSASSSARRMWDPSTSAGIEVATDISFVSIVFTAWIDLRCPNDDTGARELRMLERRGCMSPPRDLRFPFIGMGSNEGEKSPSRLRGPVGRRGQALRAGVIGGLAVAALAAGGSYAAWIPRNSVGSNQLKKGAVVSKKIGTNAVRRSEIATGAVAEPEIAAGAVGATEIAAGAVPRAYALIEAWPNVGILESASERMGSATATLGAEGYVCIDGLEFEPRNAQTTLLGTGQNALNSTLNATLGSVIDVSQCPGSEDAAFVAIDAASGVIDPSPPGFFLTLYD